MFIDSHAHLHFKEFQGEVDAVLARAQEAGVNCLINVGTDLASSREVIKLAQQHPQVFAAVGIHPHDVAAISNDDLTALAKLAQEKKVVAIGEVGLDYHYEHSPKEVQQQRLRDFIRLARETRLPLILHCRDAFADCFKILDEAEGWKVGGVFHCYTGDLETAKQIVRNGFYVSFSGIITFKKTASLQAVVREIPEDRLLIETDCPFLAPEPHRGKRNEPAYVRLVARKVAELRGQAIEAIGQKTAQNTIRLFRLPIGG